MNRRLWLIFVATALTIVGVVAAFGWVAWGSLTSAGKEAAAVLAGEIGVNAAVPLTLALVIVFFVLQWLYGSYGAPLRTIAEDTRVIAMSNAAHRPPDRGPEEIRTLIGGISLLADRYETLQRDVQLRINEAAAALEEERDTLAALMAKLTQGVLVCNMDGRVLLYNQQAQHLLEGPARRSGVGDWIGLGRSVYGIIDEGLIQHALMTVSHARDRGESLLMVPFIATRPGGQLLNVHLIPVSGKGQQWHGYVLTFDDVTRRVQSETHRAMALQSLIEMQRSSVSNIRAAVETMQAYPDMEEDRREAFEQVIHDESLRMSDRLQGLEDDVNRKLQGGWPAQDVLGSDLLAAIERHVHDALGIQIEVSVPLEPLRLRADSYAIARCVIFLIDQLCQSCRAEQVLLTIDRGKSLAALAIEWTGAPLHMEALRTWGMRNVLTTMKGESITLFEVVERHSGAIWPLPPARDGERPRLRVLLPLSDADEQEVIQSVAEAAHDFDFRLSAAAAGSGGIDGLPLNRLSYTVIDTETTGLSPGQGDEIIAIGAIRIVNGRILGRENFDSFVRPRVPVSGASQAIHGITPEMLRGQPRIEEVLPNLQRFVEDTVIVGHNIDFDMRFFEESAVRTGVRFANPVLDTLKLEYLVNPNQEEKSLEAMATRLGISVTGRHTALGDALTTAEVFLALMPLLEQRGVRTLAEAQAASEATPYARLKY